MSIRSISLLLTFVVLFQFHEILAIQMTRFTEYEFNGHNYTIAFEPLCSYDESIQLCQDAGMDFATVKSKEELAFYESLSYEAFARGRKENAFRLFGKGKNKKNDYHWGDTNEKVDSQYYVKGQPNETADACVFLWYRKGQPLGLKDDSCSIKMPTVCRSKDIQNTTTATTEKPTSAVDPKAFCANQTCGRYPDPTNCAYYFACEDVPVRQMCQHCLLFNVVLQMCDLPEYVDCGTRKRPKNVDKKSKKPGFNSTINA